MVPSCLLKDDKFLQEAAAMATVHRSKKAMYLFSYILYRNYDKKKIRIAEFCERMSRFLRYILQFLHFDTIIGFKRHKMQNDDSLQYSVSSRADRKTKCCFKWISVGEILFCYLAGFLKLKHVCTVGCNCWTKQAFNAEGFIFLLSEFQPLRKAGIWQKDLIFPPSDFQSWSRNKVDIKLFNIRAVAARSENKANNLIQGLYLYGRVFVAKRNYSMRVLCLPAFQKREFVVRELCGISDARKNYSFVVGTLYCW